MESRWLSDLGYIPLAVEAGMKFPRNWKGGAGHPDWKPPASFTSPCLSIRRDGLVPIDCDITIPELAQKVFEIVKHLDGPVRRRENSPKWTMLLACPELERAQRCLQTGAWKNFKGKTIVCVEFKGGWSYQTLTHGVHPSGVPLIWTPGGADPRDMVPKAELPIITVAEVIELRDVIHAVLLEAMGREPDRQGVNRENMTDRHVLTKSMVFTAVDGERWPVSELEQLPRGEYVQCHLDGVRPTSDSGAGIARVGPQGLVITDLVENKRLRPVLMEEPPLSNEEKDKLKKMGVGVVATQYVHLMGPNKYFKRSDIKHTMYTVAGMTEAFGKEQSLELRSSAERCDDLTWDPTQPSRAVFAVGDRRFFNTFWTPPDLTGGEAQAFIDFVDALCGEWAPWVHQWIAWKLQNPWLKGITVALVGGMGDGKSSLWRALSMLAGIHQVSNSPTMQGALEGVYHDFKYRTLYAFFHEVHASQVQSYRNKQGVAANYKEIADPVGDPAAQLNIKGKAQERVPVMCTVGIATNYPDALPLEEGDRRTFVLRVQRVPAELVKRVSDAMGIDPKTRDTPEVQANLSATYKYYMSYNIEGFDWATPPWTEAKRRMIGGNETVGGQICADFLATVEAAGGCFTWGQAMQYAGAQGLDKGELAGFKAELQNKAESKRGKKFRYWFLNTMEAPLPADAQKLTAKLATTIAARDI